MNILLKRVLGGAASVVLLAGFALLPDTLARLQDHQMLGQMHIAEIEPVELGHEDEMTVVDKIRLLSSEEYGEPIQVLELKAGVHHNAESVHDAVHEQLNALYRAGILPVYDENCLVKTHGVNFVISSTDPSRNLMFWPIIVRIGSYTYYLQIDDESGLALGLSAFSEEADGSARYGLAKLAVQWASYLGVSLDEGYEILTQNEAQNKHELKEKLGLDTSEEYNDASTAAITDANLNDYWTSLDITLRIDDKTAVCTLSGQSMGFSITSA